MWGIADLPHQVGRDTGQIVEAAATGGLGALLVGGVEVADLPDPARALAALDAAEFVVSLEQRPSEVTERADVVLPVAAVVEKSGTFLNWEGRARPFEAALKPDQMTRRRTLPDARVLHMLADALDRAWACRTWRPPARELTRLGTWQGLRATAPAGDRGPLPRPAEGEAVLAGHRLLLDQGRLQEGDPALAAPGTPRWPGSRRRPPRRRGCGRRAAARHRPGRFRPAAPVCDADARPGRLAAAGLHGRRCAARSGPAR